MTDVPQARKKVVLISRYSSPRSGPAYDGVSTVIDREIFTAEKKMADIDLLRFALSVADFSDPTEISNFECGYSIPGCTNAMPSALAQSAR